MANRKNNRTLIAKATIPQGQPSQKVLGDIARGLGAQPSSKLVLKVFRGKWRLCGCADGDLLLYTSTKRPPKTPADAATMVLAWLDQDRKLNGHLEKLRINPPLKTSKRVKRVRVEGVAYDCMAEDIVPGKCRAYYPRGRENTDHPIYLVEHLDAAANHPWKWRAYIGRRDSQFTYAGSLTGHGPGARVAIYEIRRKVAHLVQNVLAPLILTAGNTNR